MLYRGCFTFCRWCAGDDLFRCLLVACKQQGVEMPSRMRCAPVERQAAAFRQLLLSALQGASSARLSFPASPIAVQQQQKSMRIHDKVIFTTKS